MATKDPRQRAAEMDGRIVRHLADLAAFVRLRAGPLVRANESCADIAQSACREVLAHADRFEFGSDAEFRRWLFTTALRKITDRKRYYLADKRRGNLRAGQERSGGDSDPTLANRLEAELTSPSQAAMRREDVERLERAFDQLSETDREVITLARVAGLSHAEIAKRTGASVGAVRVRLSRALTRLASLMREGRKA